MKAIEAAKLVAMLSAAYRDAKLNAEASQVYEAMLADLDFGLAQEAVWRLIRTSKWLPTVAEIRQTAADIERGPVRRGAEAYADVIAEIRRVGSYGTPRFADPVTAECVKAMTWRGLCLGDNEAADRARFIELYDSLAARQRVDIVAGRQLPSGPAKRALAPVAPRQLASEALPGYRVGPKAASEMLRRVPDIVEDVAAKLREARPTLPAPPPVRMSVAELEAALDKRAGGAR
jgi:hypothetical protein